MAAQRDSKQVIVAGDVTIDWHLARARRLPAEWRGWNADDFTRLSCRSGGAALLADLLRALGEHEAGAGGPAWEVHGPSALTEPLQCADPRFYHSHAVWERFPIQKGRDVRRVWRVAEFLG